MNLRTEVKKKWTSVHQFTMPDTNKKYNESILNKSIWNNAQDWVGQGVSLIMKVTKPQFPHEISIFIIIFLCQYVSIDGPGKYIKFY